MASPWDDNYSIIDEWGEIVSQWTPALTSDGEQKLLPVWVDAPEDDDIIWVSKLGGMSWGNNVNLSGNDASEPRSPGIAPSADGRLHAA